MTATPPPLPRPPRPPIRAPHIEWPTAVVLCAMLAALVAVWALARPEQQATLLSGVGAVGGVVLAFMRAMLRAKEADPPYAPPPSANGLDRNPPAELLDDGLPRRRPTAFKRAAPALAMLVLTGCGASALRVQALAADTTGRILDATCAEVETARARELEELPPTREEAHAHIDAAVERWAPAVSSCNVLSDAHGAWADVLVRAAAGGELDLGLALALAVRISSAWPDLGALLARRGIVLPPLPTQLAALGGGQ